MASENKKQFVLKTFELFIRAHKELGPEGNNELSNKLYDYIRRVYAGLIAGEVKIEKALMPNTDTVRFEFSSRLWTWKEHFTLDQKNGTFSYGTIEENN